jgi:hypothetical protein
VSDEDRATERLWCGDVTVEGLPHTVRAYRWCGPDHDVTLAPLPQLSPTGAALWAVRIAAEDAPHTSAPTRTGLEDLFRRTTGWSGVRFTEAAWVTAYDCAPDVADRMRDGRVFLAGDAAHGYLPHPPDASTGLYAGMRDATNLGWKLAAVLHGAGEDLLDSYEAERLPPAGPVRRSRRSADPVRDLLGGNGGARRVARATGRVVRVLPPPLAAVVVRRRIVAGRARREARDLHYRESRLSQELGGKRVLLRAGDRVPDVRLWTPARAVDVRLSEVRLAEVAPSHVAPSEVLSSGVRTSSATPPTCWTVLGLGSVTTEVVRAAVHRFGPAVRGEVIGGGLGAARGVTLLDRYGEARRMLGRQGGSVLVVRPDGHLGLRCGLNPDILVAYLENLIGPTAEVID